MTPGGVLPPGVVSMWVLGAGAGTGITHWTQLSPPGGRGLAVRPVEGGLLPEEGGDELAPEEPVSRRSGPMSGARRVEEPSESRAPPLR